MDMDDGLSRWLLSRGPDCIDARALPDGAAFGPFRILGRIGRGGSADVFRARRESDGAVVAVKVPRRPDAVAAERFRREAALLSAHPHPALPALLDSGEAVRPGLPGKNGADGARLPFLALEELVPLDLPRSSAGVARFLEALCGGVAHLHALGFVHRDIKPSNVMRRPGSESPVLIDFGLVKEAAAAPGPAELGSVPLSVESGRAVVRGTPGYAAPEQFAGADASPAADVYALGMIALRCFGGRPPLSWRRVLRRATAPLPEARYRDAEAFARAVRRRRRPFLAAAGLAAAAALCFAAAVRAAVSERHARVRTGESAVSVLADLLSSANPETGGGRSSATVVSAVEKAVPSIRAEKAPSLRSALALEAGRLFEGVGRFAEAESLYGTAVEALRASGAPDAELAGALHRRGVARRRRDDLAGAETDLREALALRRALAARPPKPGRSSPRPFPRSEGRAVSAGRRKNRSRFSWKRRTSAAPFPAKTRERGSGRSLGPCPTSGSNSATWSASAKPSPRTTKPSPRSGRSRALALPAPAKTLPGRSDSGRTRSAVPVASTKPAPTLPRRRRKSAGWPKTNQGRMPSPSAPCSETRRPSTPKPAVPNPPAP